MDIYIYIYIYSQSQCPRGLRRSSTAARLLRLWVRILPGAWMFICCECCMFSGRDLCDELITRPEESYLLWCVVVCDLETSRMRRPWPALGRSATKKKEYILVVCNWNNSKIRVKQQTFCHKVADVAVQVCYLPQTTKRRILQHNILKSVDSKPKSPT